MRKQYIHYGNNRFDIDIFKEKQSNAIDNSCLNKPPYGFWASPVGSDYWTWREWCESEDWHTDRLDTYFKFTLTKKARILTVRKREDIFPYLVKNTRLSGCVLDFDKIMSKYDGMELIHGKRYNELHYNEFYSWDVDSIVIWNPYIIVPMSSSDFTSRSRRILIEIANKMTRSDSNNLTERLILGDIKSNTEFP